MYYLVYILAGFGIFSLLVILLKLILWLTKYDIDKKFIPIGESGFNTNRNSMITLNTKEAIEQMDRMLDQYTKPKIVISRQCICPSCSKETDKLILNDGQKCDTSGCSSDKLIVEESEEQLERASIGSGNDKSETSEGSIASEIIIIEDTSDGLPCKLYNNVVSELKRKFSMRSTDNSNNRSTNESNNIVKSEANGLSEVVVETNNI